MIRIPVSQNIQENSSKLSAAKLKSMNRTKAAKEFEGLILQQLVKVLRSSVSQEGLFGGKTPGADMYMHMFDQAFASQLVESGGIGMRGMFEESLGGEVDSSATQNPSEAQGSHGFSRMNVSFPRSDIKAPNTRVNQSIVTKSSVGPTSGKSLSGAVGSMQRVARQMLSSGQAKTWAKDGKLTAQHLQSDISTAVPGGVAKFNVRDANGYQGYNKCNLFSLEMVRRAGFQVPLIKRARGWGFPSSNHVAGDASDKSLSGNWGKVVTGMDAQSLDQNLVSGNKAFLLVGSASDGRSGHMAIVERVHQVDYDADGNVKRIAFDGWEARTKGASHLKKRTWNLAGNSGGHLARNGFNGIEIIELIESGSAKAEGVPLSKNANPSRFDHLFSSLMANRPNVTLEGEL